MNNLFKRLIRFATFPVINGFILGILFPETYILKIIIIVVGLELLIEFKTKSIIKNNE